MVVGCVAGVLRRCQPEDRQVFIATHFKICIMSLGPFSNFFVASNSIRISSLISEMVINSTPLNPDLVENLESFSLRVCDAWIDGGHPVESSIPFFLKGDLLFLRKNMSGAARLYQNGILATCQNMAKCDQLGGFWNDSLILRVIDVHIQTKSMSAI